MVLPKAIFPLVTNPASFSGPQLCSGTPTISFHHPVDPIISEPTAPLLEKPTFSQPSASILVATPTIPLSLAERIRRSEDKSLHRVSNVLISESSFGRPRIKIHDSVFKKGADLHKEFIVAYFCGGTPAYGSIQKC